MAQRIVYIDAYNVLHKVPRLSRLLASNADAARRGLVTMLSSRREHATVMHIVFDSCGEPINDVRDVTVVFSMSRSADAWIRMRVEQERNPRAVLVVSSDREVISHAAAMGAAVRTAEEFLGNDLRALSRAEVPEKETRPLSKGEINEWMALFQRQDPQP